MKMSLKPGMPLYVECINDLNAKKCVQCMDCKDHNCGRVHCDAHNQCLCFDTQCICLGRS